MPALDVIFSPQLAQDQGFSMIVDQLLYNIPLTVYSKRQVDTVSYVLCLNHTTVMVARLPILGDELFQHQNKPRKRGH